MRSLFTICFVLVLISRPVAQVNSDDETVVRNIADYILRHAEFKFEGTSNGQVYHSTKEIPENVEVDFKSPFGEWHYTNGVLNMAMLDLAAFLNEE